MVRLLIEDVTIRRDSAITVHIRLKGGQTHSLSVTPPLTAGELRKTPPEVVTAIDTLLDEHTPAEIAEHLNVYPLTVKRWRRASIITGHPYNDKGECLNPVPTGEINRPTIGRPPKPRMAGSK